MPTRLYLFLGVLFIVTACPESNFDPKSRWGGGLKGVLSTVQLASETGTTGPLDTICGITPNIPTNCIAICPALDPGTGWFLTGKLQCANQPPGTAGNGLWESICVSFKEGLQAGQDEALPHSLNFIVTKPSSGKAGTISLQADMIGDIFILPYAIDKVWVKGRYYLSRSLTAGGTQTFTAGDMALECKDDSTVEIDMIKITCEKFKTSYYDIASCS